MPDRLILAVQVLFFLLFGMYFVLIAVLMTAVLRAHRRNRHRPGVPCPHCDSHIAKVPPPC